jgi:hypothetical protein
MQLKDRDGIACDLCGASYKTDFRYYSFDMRNVAVNNNLRPPVNSILSSNVAFSLDVCEKCMGGVAEDIKKNYKAVKNSVCCDLTGKVMTGTFDFYFCQVVRADVKMTGRPNVCANCGVHSAVLGEPCKDCGGSEFVKFADTVVDDRYLDIHMCEEAYDKFVNKAMDVRKIAGQWSTTT